MGKKVREYKSGDFIFAKVKGYPAWPARVQKLNGKKYFVYFYGTGETANLPPNMIFDYAENKDKFLNKSVKRRDFNDGVKQIEHDFANNVPLEQVIGVPMEVGPDTTANDSAIDTSANDTLDDTANETADDTVNTTQNDGGVEDSDETGALIIDEGGKQAAKGKKKPEPKPATPKTTPKTPRGKKKENKQDEDEKNEEEIVSRSGRKIRPKRYIDEQTEDNTTLPTPVAKKRRATSPEKDKEIQEKEKNINHFNTVTQSELEDLKEPFKSEDAEKDNILIAYLPSGQYVGIRLFTARPNSFKNEASRLQWDKQAASNAITLKMQLERGQITPQSIQAQLVMDLNLTDEEKATLDKERETEEKKTRVQFLKTEMKLIELDAKIKTCLCLEKADTEMCLKLLDELMELDVKPLMLLKHPTCLETVKRMRAYVGNTPSWDLSENESLLFSKQAHRIRRQADTLYNNMKELFITPSELSFWEYFSERVVQFKKATSKLSPSELLEMVHEPIELSQPSTVTMKTALEAAAEEEPPIHEDTNNKKKNAAKTKKAPATPKGKRGRKQTEDKEEKEKVDDKHNDTDKDGDKMDTDADNNEQSEQEKPKENDIEMQDAEKDAEKSKEKDTPEAPKEKESNDSNAKDAPAKENSDESQEKDNLKDTQEKDTPTNDSEEIANSKDLKNNDEKVEQNSEETEKGKEKDTQQKDTEQKGKNKEGKDTEAKDKQDEPRAKRTRETKKTEAPPPRSPAKRKSKF